MESRTQSSAIIHAKGARSCARKGSFFLAAKCSWEYRCDRHEPGVEVSKTDLRSAPSADDKSPELTNEQQQELFEYEREMRHQE
jgi:hypothetical protein